jgi:hypothetical protein
VRVRTDELLEHVGVQVSVDIGANLANSRILEHELGESRLPPSDHPSDIGAPSLGTSSVTPAASDSDGCGRARATTSNRPSAALTTLCSTGSRRPRRPSGGMCATRSGTDRKPNPPPAFASVPAYGFRPSSQATTARRRGERAALVGSRARVAPSVPAAPVRR